MATITGGGCFHANGWAYRASRVGWPLTAAAPSFKASCCSRPMGSVFTTGGAWGASLSPLSVVLLASELVVESGELSQEEELLLLLEIAHLEPGQCFQTKPPWVEELVSKPHFSNFCILAIISVAFEDSSARATLY